MATVQDVLNAAKVLNRKTQEHAQVSAGGMEVVEAVNRTLRGIYQIGARVNPAYHGAVHVEAESIGTWSRPTDAELITLVRDATGAEVIVSTPREPIPDPQKPCIVRWGRSYMRPAGHATPTGNLTFWFSRRPVTASGMMDIVDLDEYFLSLVVYDLGMWLAHRDERWDELPALMADRDRYLALYVASLEHEDTGVVRNVGQGDVFDSPSLMALKELLFTPGGE